MKKLTAGIFATLLTMVSVDGAYAAIASKGYVDQQVGTKADASTVTSLQGTVSEHTTQIAGKADSSTVTALDGRVDAAEGEIDALQTEVDGKQDALGFTPENSANKTTTLSGTSTDAQYPSAKAVWDTIQTETEGIASNTDVTALKERVDTLETASATHATKTALSEGLAGKQDKLSQTGSASQPVYVNEQGVVTAGNTIPSVTTNITKGQTAAAQAGAVADALAAKANATDLEDYVTETEADAAYAVKALEGQVGTVSKENMGTTNATTVVGGVKEAIDAAKAADTKAGEAATAASTAQSAAEAAQGEVDALEVVVNNETTGLAAAHTAIDAVEGRVTTAEGEIDTIQGKISNMATSETVKGLQTDVAGLKTSKLDKAIYDSQVGTVSAGNMGTTATTVVTAIKEVAGEAEDAQSAASAADSKAQAAQETANAAIPKPDGECSNPTNKCVLTWNNSAYAWEVIERGAEE